jgi:hypothetical protein
VMEEITVVVKVFLYMIYHCKEYMFFLFQEYNTVTSMGDMLTAESLNVWSHTMQIYVSLDI